MTVVASIAVTTKTDKLDSYGQAGRQAGEQTVGRAGGWTDGLTNLYATYTSLFNFNFKLLLWKWLIV